MNVRIKYTKSGVLKFIGHLDVMRFFQKAVKRAGLDIAYSKGFSPHQLMSFAAPLALGVTSEGEYFDAEFNTLVTSDEFVRRLNEQMTPGMAVSDVILLPEKAKNSMSIVAASDYRIHFKGSLSEDPVLQQKLLQTVPDFLTRTEIPVIKKTKKGEKTENIRPGILKCQTDSASFYMLLSTGSEYNLKPELVLQALCEQAGVTYNLYDYQVHRIETYMKNEDGQLVSLLQSGKRITEQTLKELQAVQEMEKSHESGDLNTL